MISRLKSGMVTLSTNIESKLMLARESEALYLANLELHELKELREQVNTLIYDMENKR